MHMPGDEGHAVGMVMAHWGMHHRAMRVHSRRRVVLKIHGTASGNLVRVTMMTHGNARRHRTIRVR